MNFFQKYAAGGALRPDSFTGMQPDFSSALQAMIAGAPPDVQSALQIYSGYRSPQRQKALYADALAKYGSPEAARKWVAPPGRSNHNHGLAADLKFLDDGSKAWVHQNAGTYGLAFPLGNEPWHVELASARGGAPQTAASAVTALADAAPKPQAIANEPMDRPKAVPSYDDLTGAAPMAKTDGPKMPQGVGGLGGLGGFVPPQRDDSFDTGGLLQALGAALMAGDASVFPQMIQASEARREKRYDRRYEQARDDWMFGVQRQDRIDDRTDRQNDRIADNARADRQLDLQATELRDGKRTADMRNYDLSLKDPNFAKFVGGGQAGKPPTIVEQFDENGAPRKMIWDADKGAYVPFGGSKAAPTASDFDMTLPDGTRINLGGKLTEGQSKDVGFYQRGNAALETLDANEAALTGAGDRLAGVLPGGNYLTSDAYKLADQSGREFLAAILRKDSGAALTNEEMANYGKTYLPQPGDSEVILNQKRASRRRAMEAIKLGLGTASDLSRVPLTQNPGAAAADSADAPPAGIDAEDWKMLTPEEKRLWQN